jgi:predicted RNase H-like HicB family nuclease
MALPTIVDNYVCAAMKHAFLERVDDAFAATVPEAFGVVALAATEQDCLADLRARLEDWVCVSRSNGFALPVIEGIDLNSVEGLPPSLSDHGNPRGASRQVFENEHEFEAALDRPGKRSKQAG